MSKIDYTLSSEIEELADGSEALFIGKVEGMEKKVSKKGNNFTVATLVDFHGSINLTLFEKHLTQIEAFDLNKPIAFKVRLQKGDRFTKINILKIESLADATKEKIKVEKIKPKSIEEIKEPVIVSINLSSKPEIIDKLIHLTEKYRGSRPLELHIHSKNADVIIESQIYVSESIVEHLGELEELKT